MLFVRGLGFITGTEARRITFEDAVRFEKVHEDAYRELGYECVDVPAAPVDERAEFVCGLIKSVN